MDAPPAPNVTHPVPLEEGDLGLNRLSGHANWAGHADAWQPHKIQQIGLVGSDRNLLNFQLGKEGHTDSTASHAKGRIGSIPGPPSRGGAKFSPTQESPNPEISRFPGAAGAGTEAPSNVLVVKLGGGAGVDAEPLLRELAALREPWVLVHGGNAAMDDLTRRLGREPRFVTSPSGHTSRVTDAATVELLQMSYRGRTNNDLVLRLQRHGANAVGLSGVDGRLLQARRKEAIRIVENGRTLLLRDDFTGKVHTVNAALLRVLLGAGYRPVVTLPAYADGEAVNVDADRAAALVAASLGAPRLVILSNVPGLLRDPADLSSLVRHIPRDGLEGAEGFAQGRFKKKLLAVREAIAGGVGQVVLADARRATPLADALAGEGTVVG